MGCRIGGELWLDLSETDHWIWSVRKEDEVKK